MASWACKYDEIFNRYIFHISLTVRTVYLNFNEFSEYEELISGIYDE
jgi:hypothetical protein